VQDLEQIRARVSEDLTASLLSLLADSPDPDQALNLCEKLVSTCGHDLIRLLEANRVLLHYAIVIFGHSHWLGDALIRNPGLLDLLNREKTLERSLGREDYRQRLALLRSLWSESDVSTVLAGFKKQEYIRITLRDTLGIATLAETAEEISALADVIIQEALDEAESRVRNRCEPPKYPGVQGRLADGAFTVLAMGKLGGNELNYSSDVDLLYIYESPESSDTLFWREYFIRLAQELTGILSAVTTEGAVFRIDLRLRPQGHEGEPALGVQNALDYYAHAAHDWELQALIKARHSAGDAVLAREFIRGVQNKVYTADLNFQAVETALHSREKIGARRRRPLAASKGAAIDVKLDRGGIRDIEFLVQCLQRVYGGAEPWLRSGGTLFSLQKLHDKDHLASRDFHEITVAYEFLRKVEHRLQLQRGQQSHRLPVGSAEVEVLRRAVNGGQSEEDANAFLTALKSRMASVAGIYDRVIRRQRVRRSPIPALAVSEAVFRPGSFEQVLHRAAAESPALAAVASRSDLSLHARRALQRFVSAAMTSADRWASLTENPVLIGRAIALLETSDYLTDVLVQHPDELRLLDGLRGIPGEELDLTSLVEPIAVAADLSEAMAVLRQNFRRKMFLVAAQDVLALRPALESMHYATAAGDAAIRSALHIAGGDDILAVFALGRLGTQEFDIASDADLLFVRDAPTNEEQARTVAEKLIHVLSAYTREGAVFAVDARLRPRGGEGELVVTPTQLERYLADESQPWEALTYTKLRFVAGRNDIAAATQPIAWRRVVARASQDGFSQQVIEMRARLEKSNRYLRSFKLARGGFYDIDFIVSFLLLRLAEPVHGNTEDRLEHLHRGGRLDTFAFSELKRAACLYRTADHVIRLVTGRVRPELPEAEHAHDVSVALINRILGRESGNDLQSEIVRTKEAVRAIFIDLIETRRI
jgi:glutamate-ammonia-ligase adenylyltransferase